MIEYIKARYNEKISLVIGILLIVAFVIGKVSGMELGIILNMFDLLGLELPSFVDVIVGAGVIAAPTSGKLK